MRANGWALAAGGAALLAVAIWRPAAGSSPPLAPASFDAAPCRAGAASMALPAAAESGSVAWARGDDALPDGGDPSPKSDHAPLGPTSARDLRVEFRGDLRSVGAVQVVALDAAGLVCRRWELRPEPWIVLSEVPAAARFVVALPRGVAAPACVAVPEREVGDALTVELTPAWSLGGTVHDAAGQPLVGCEVRARLPVDAAPERALDRCFPRVRLARLDDRGRTIEARAIVQRTVVDAAGRFRLEGLPHRSLELEIVTGGAITRARVCPGESPQLTVACGS